MLKTNDKVRKVGSNTIYRIISTGLSNDVWIIPLKIYEDYIKPQGEFSQVKHDEYEASKERVNANTLIRID